MDYFDYLITSLNNNDLNNLLKKTILKILLNSLLNGELGGRFHLKLFDELIKLSDQISYYEDDQLQLIKLNLFNNLFADFQVFNMLNNDLLARLVNHLFSLTCHLPLNQIIRSSSENSLQIFIISLSKFVSSSHDSGQDYTSTLTHLISLFVKHLNPLNISINDSIRLSSLRLLQLTLSCFNFNNEGFNEDIFNTLSNDGCKFCFQLTTSSNLQVLLSSLNFVQTLFNKFDNKLKLQQELFFSFLLQRLTNNLNFNQHQQQSSNLSDFFTSYQSKILPSNLITNFNKFNSSSSITPTFNPLKNSNSSHDLSKIILLDSLYSSIQSSNFLFELYLNFDSNIDRDDLFENVFNFISFSIFPIHQLHSSHSQLISLHSILVYIHQLNEAFDNSNTQTLPQETSLTSSKWKKSIILNGTKLFNVKPGKGIEYLIEQGILSNDDMDIAKFLKSCSRLDKQKLGDYISHPNNLKILFNFLSLFNFNNLNIADSMRKMLESFRLPGEAQQISRITETFAEVYFNTQPKGIKSQDSVYVLAYSVIMLNTDLHNPQIRSKRMSSQAYKKNLRGVNDGENFDDDYLEIIYQSILKREIIMPEEHQNQFGFNYAWNEMLHNSQIDGQLVKFSNDRSDLLELLFKNTYNQLLITLPYSLTSILNGDDDLIYRLIESYKTLVKLATHFKVNKFFDIAFISLRNALGILKADDDEGEDVIDYKLNESEYLKISNQSMRMGNDINVKIGLKILFNVILNEGSYDYLEVCWKDIFEILMKLFNLNLLPSNVQKLEEFLDGSTAIPDQGKRSHKNTQDDESTTGNASGTSSSLLSTLSSYLLSPYSNDEMTYQPTEKDVQSTKDAKKFINECDIHSLYKAMW